jgi:hypothetical protein
MEQPSPDTNNPLANFAQAIPIFQTISQTYPNSEQAALAQGEIGDCYLQLASQDTNKFDSAAKAYAQVVSSTNADVPARSQAQIGLGIVLEKLAAQAGTNQIALLKQARDNYYDVFKGNNLRDDKGEKADAFWQKKAGLETERLEESLQEWMQAVNIYKDMTNNWPPLQATLENRIHTIITEHPEAKEEN